MKHKSTKYLFAIIIIIGCIIPYLVHGKSIVVSTVKNPNIYSNNFTWFHYNQNPGTTIKDSLVLQNMGDHEETVKLYPTDATVNQSGSFTPKLESDTQSELGLWSQLSKTEVTLKPSESVEVPFSIKIPQDISPGQYFGSIISEQVSANNCPNDYTNNGSCPGNIQIKTRTGNRIYLTIPGELKRDIVLQNVIHEKGINNKILFKFNFINKGNIAFEPQVTLHIYNTWGQEIKTIEAYLGKSLPNSSITPIVEWYPGNEFGQFKIKAEIKYKEISQNTLHGSAYSLNKNIELSIFIFPWKLTIITFTFLIILGLYLLVKKHYYTNLLKNTFDYIVQENDSILNIAKKHDLNWKTIIKINKLKAPFILEKNQIIKLPYSDKQNKN